MKVHELMERDVATCGTQSSGADAARAMWERDCGVIPVVSTERCAILIAARLPNFE